MMRWPLVLIFISGWTSAGVAEEHPTFAPSSLSSTSTATPDAQTLLRQAMDLYVVGRYREAAERLRPLVEASQLKDVIDQKEALRAYGTSLYLSGGTSGAERAFRDLLRIDPKTRLDPAFVRPEVVRFFEEVRWRNEYDLNDVVRQRGPQGHAAANLLPPWGQFQNHHKTKGYWLLGGELGLTALSITTGALLYSWRSETGEFKDHEGAYRPVSLTNYISFGALVGLVLYGIIDGLYYYYSAPPPMAPRGL
jgi:hypothetical protein